MATVQRSTPQQGGGGAGGAMMMDGMAALLPYLPRILSFAKQAPAFIAGFLIATALHLFVLGPSYFAAHIAPVAGFHVVALIALSHLLPIVLASIATIRAAKKQASAVTNLSSDIKTKQNLLRHAATDLD